MQSVCHIDTKTILKMQINYSHNAGKSEQIPEIEGKALHKFIIPGTKYCMILLVIGSLLYNNALVVPYILIAPV